MAILNLNYFPFISLIVYVHYPVLYKGFLSKGQVCSVVLAPALRHGKFLRKKGWSRS